MGRAMHGHRDELFIATKFCTPYGHLPPGTPVAEYMGAIEGSLRRLGTDHVDLVHIHSLFLFPQYAAYREALRADVPYVVSFHGAMDPYLRKRGRLRKWLTDRAWQADMLNRAAAIHVTSADEQTLTAEIAPRVPRVLAPNGIYWDRFQDLPDGREFRNARLNGHEGPIVLSLGRIARKKAPERLVRAIADVLAQHPSALLVFAGPDDEGLGDGLRKLARSLGVEASVLTRQISAYPIESGPRVIGPV